MIFNLTCDACIFAKRNDALFFYFSSRIFCVFGNSFIVKELDLFVKDGLLHRNSSEKVKNEGIRKKNT